ncbi:hypothetical protein [Anaerostipes hominis (ex Lee et al. 2021)]|uniref:hypothetical protein n=1 Tax=Anaerostipes hominis (ex Lee et al. 2021) TaxID=2025494 RepID=UPI0022DF4F42|nr:hypothetical protein [Anaerostipes hominis (ex Lee et al. 2021)]
MGKSKNVELIVTTRYNDLKLNKILEIGDTISVSQVRAKVLLEKGFVKEVKENEQ